MNGKSDQGQEKLTHPTPVGREMEVRLLVQHRHLVSAGMPPPAFSPPMQRILQKVLTRVERWNIVRPFSNTRRRTLTDLALIFLATHRLSRSFRILAIAAPPSLSFILT